MQYTNCNNYTRNPLTREGIMYIELYIPDLVGSLNKKGNVRNLSEDKFVPRIRPICIYVYMNISMKEKFDGPKQPHVLSCIQTNCTRQSRENRHLFKVG